MVRKNQVKLMVAGILVVAFMTGCSLSNDGAGGKSANDNRADENSVNVESDRIFSTDLKDAGDNAGERKNQTDTQGGQAEDGSQPQPQAAEDTRSIEEELAAYRAEREEGTSTLGDYIMAKLPNEENYHYGIGESTGHISGFDSRELNEVYETAGAYVRDTLNLESEVWGCVDPRMNAIYEDEDKGVANGYDADNIFLCEYNDNGNWRYLILVREGKGSDWEVLYHGSSYKMD